VKDDYKNAFLHSFDIFSNALFTKSAKYYLTDCILDDP